MTDIVKNLHSVSHCLSGSGSQSVFRGLLGVEECKDPLEGNHEVKTIFIIGLIFTVLHFLSRVNSS